MSRNVLRARRRRPHPEFPGPQLSDCPRAGRAAGPLNPAAEPPWARGSSRKRKERGGRAQASGREAAAGIARGQPTRAPWPRSHALPVTWRGCGSAPPAGARPPGLQEGGARLRARATRRSRVLPPSRRRLHGCHAGRALCPAARSWRQARLA